MAFNINNNISGSKVFGRDRMGHVVPDLEFTETLRPFLPVAYPAPYCPALRQDQAHPVLASVVLSSQHAVGLDKNNALIPAGYFCGTQGREGKSTITSVTVASNVATFSATNNYVVGDNVIVTITGTGSTLSGTYAVVARTGTTFNVATTSANLSATTITGTGVLATAGQYFALRYTGADIGTTYNPLTGNLVAAVNEVAVLAAPSDGVVGDTITFPDGFVYTIVSGDLTSAFACNLFPQGVARAIGVTIRQVYQYIGGVTVLGTTGGIVYRLDGVLPLKYQFLNYMHEAGTAIQTEMIIRTPWIGATETTLNQLTAADGVTGYAQTAYGRSFGHFVGAAGFGPQFLAPGARVVAARGVSAGNFTVYNPAIDDPTNVVGVVLGVINQYPIKDYVNRVRTLYNPKQLGGPIADPNPASIQMGGSATSGMDYIINLGTDAAFTTAYTQNKTLHPEYSTFVEIAFRSF